MRGSELGLVILNNQGGIHFVLDDDDHWFSFDGQSGRSSPLKSGDSFFWEGSKMFPLGRVYITDNPYEIIFDPTPLVLPQPSGKALKVRITDGLEQTFLSTPLEGQTETACSLPLNFSEAPAPVPN